MGLNIKISINGNAYDRLEDVPEEIRKLIDKDGDGVPDVVQMEMKDKRAAEQTEVVKQEASAEELRAGIKALLADRDNDGIPDVTQKRGPVTTRVTTTISRTYNVNGKTYKSLEQMPAEVRSAMERAGLGRGRAAGGAVPGDENWDPAPGEFGPRAIGPGSGLGIKTFFKRLFRRK